MGSPDKTQPVPHGKGLAAAYHTYFTSGHYDKRYPHPNLTTWHRILAILPKAAHLIDFGCGSGRYLLSLKGHVGMAAGFDISTAALALLQERAQQQGWADLGVLGPDPIALSEYVKGAGQADVVLCLFGVLAHVSDALERQQALAQIHAALKPGTGTLLISVPNKLRRFHAEQRRAGADDVIEYHRQMGSTHLTLPYQLYDPQRLTRELAAAGFSVLSLRAESVFPESWLLNHATARWLDRLLTPLCPAAWGYGILAEARA
ncbi:MAG: class I SAM-dependent methyltransferase [Roseobacter sp.]